MWAIPFAVPVDPGRALQPGHVHRVGGGPLRQQADREQQSEREHDDDGAPHRGNLSWDRLPLPRRPLPQASSEPGEAYQSGASVQVKDKPLWWPAGRPGGPGTLGGAMTRLRLPGGPVPLVVAAVVVVALVAGGLFALVAGTGARAVGCWAGGRAGGPGRGRPGDPEGGAGAAHRDPAGPGDPGRPRRPGAGGGRCRAAAGRAGHRRRRAGASPASWRTTAAAGSAPAPWPRRPATGWWPRPSTTPAPRPAARAPSPPCDPGPSCGRRSCPSTARRSGSACPSASGSASRWPTGPRSSAGSR